MLQRIADWQITRRVVDRAFAAWARMRMSVLDRLDIQQVQRRTLDRLIRRAERTKFGKEHDFGRIRCPEDFRRLVPLRDYEAFRKEYFGSFPRLENVLWPGVIPYFALSSGTTGASTKYIPLTHEMLRSNRRAALTMLASFLATHPEAGLFLGKMLFLGGSTELVKLDEGILGGDLSGIVNLTASDWMRLYTYPSAKLGLVSDWEATLDRFAHESSTLPITLISGVPSWLLLLFARVRAKTGAKTMAEAWPHLRCVVHGGMRFDPYRALVEKELGDQRIALQECYPCSEGFVAFEDMRHGLLRPIPDHEIYFEFVPVAELEHAHPSRHGLWEVVPGVQYAIAMTTCAGLWAYLVGDTVCFEKTNPPLLHFTGRTKYFSSDEQPRGVDEEAREAQRTSLPRLDNTGAVTMRE